MVAIVILRQDGNGNLYDQDGHLRNATDDDFWQVVKHEKLGEGDFKVESSMSFGGSLWCMPSSTRSNKDKHLLFSEDPAHLERTIRKDQRSTSLDAAAFTSTDSHTQPSTDTRPSSSTDLHRSTSIDTTPRTSIDHQSRNMVAIVILRQDENGNLYDQDGHLRNATVVKHEKLGEGDFKVESSMSFGRSLWCRPMSMDEHRSTDYDEDRSMDYSNHRSMSSAKSTAECSAVRIMAHEEFTEKHPHPPSTFYVKIDRRHEPVVDRQRETDIDRPPSPPIDRRAPLTYRVRLPSIDSDRINALRPPLKPLANPPEPTTNPSDTTPEPMKVDEATEGRRLRKRKEKIPKNLKWEANEKEMDGFTKRVLRIPVEKPFDEVYYTHRLWMLFRETKETEEDIRRMFHHVREMMKLRITLKKKSDPGKFAIPCVVKGIEFPHALCDTGASVNILPKVMADQLDQFYPDFAFQQPNKKGRDDNSIGSWADSGFHESFEVETVIPSSNEDPTEEYDEDYWKERAIEIAMQDERYSRHSFNNTSPPSIDRVYSASVDTHPYPEKQSYASIDTTPGTSIDIKVAAFEKEKGNIPIPSRDPDGHTRAMDGIILQVSREDIANILQLANGPDNLAPSPSIDRRYECGRRAYEIYGARKFRWEQKDEYGVYRDESGYGRSVAGEMIPVTKDNIRKILERASLFEGSHICLPEHATSFTPAKVAPEIYTKDEINEMVTGICGAQEKLGDELKTLVDDTYQPLDRGYNELFRSMAQMRTEIESMQHILEKEATTSPSIDANKATSIDVKPQTSQIPAGPDSLVEKKDEWEIAYINTKINDVYNPLNNNVDWLSTRIDLLQQEGPTTNHIDRYLHHHIDRQQVRSHGR
ncbi:hypothetical protein DY000_02060179 [Brassica cretica]|uniref:Peptidase A2 domain-containing protein n=1 Tax=Brassica cretica TaxID=69181 RepID=A0ABQ7AUJ7_BRACR|nr:hypothetical protein DY000_02060179 [Brassica cretica]